MSGPAKRDCDDAMVGRWRSDEAVHQRDGLWQPQPRERGGAFLLKLTPKDALRRPRSGWSLVSARRRTVSDPPTSSDAEAGTNDRSPRPTRRKGTNKQQEEEGDHAEKTLRDRERKWKCFLGDAKPYKNRVFLTRHTEGNHKPIVFAMARPISQSSLARLTGATTRSACTTHCDHHSLPRGASETVAPCPKVSRQRTTAVAGAKSRRILPSSWLLTLGFSYSTSRVRSMKADGTAQGLKWIMSKRDRMRWCFVMPLACSNHNE